MSTNEKTVTAPVDAESKRKDAIRAVVEKLDALDKANAIYDSIRKDNREMTADEKADVQAAYQGDTLAARIGKRMYNDVKSYRRDVLNFRKNSIDKKAKDGLESGYRYIEPKENIAIAKFLADEKVLSLYAKIDEALDDLFAKTLDDYKEENEDLFIKKSYRNDGYQPEDFE